ncbi:MAG: Dabb family protein [Clostridia bacterium]|nr:Dabb family protein [Clostridia bacterium]
MRHYIIIKLKDTSLKNEVARRARAIFEKTLELEGVESVEVYENCVDRPNRFDVMIEITMRLEALAIYDPSDAHTEWKRYCDPLLEAKAVFDCE